MNRIRRVFKFVPAVLALLLFAGVASAQVVGNTASVGLTMTLSESISISTSASSVALVYNQANNTATSAATPFTTTVTYAAAASRASVMVYAFLSSSSAALVGSASGFDIPASDVFVNNNYVNSPVICSVGNLAIGGGVSGADCGGYIARLNIGPSTDIGTYTATNWVVTLANLPNPLPIDTYTGTLNIMCALI